MNPTPEPTQYQPAQVAWREDGSPTSPEYDDVFHSRAGAVAQTEHVFLGGNGFPQRWSESDWHCIAELGFGSGLNFLVTLSQFLQHAPGSARLGYVAVEQQPWSHADSERLFRLNGIAGSLRQQWLQCLPHITIGPNRLSFSGGRVQLSLFVGEAQALLPHIRARVQAWFLDGFNPASNPAMWSASVLHEVGRLSGPGASLATWCSAGAVRRALAAQGFVVEKRPGFGNKREMSVGRLSGKVDTSLKSGPVQVIGAGLVGCWMARELAERGLRVQLHERQGAPACGASKMPMLIVRPFARHRDTPMARFLWQAAYIASRRYAQMDLPSWRAGPVYRAHADEEPHWLEPAGWFSGAEACERLLDHPGIACHWGSSPEVRAGSGPQIWCTATPPDGVELWGQIQAIRGQQSLWPEQGGSLGDKDPRVGDCVSAGSDAGLYFGASYRPGDDQDDVRPQEALDYGELLPQPPLEADLAGMRHWAAVRRQSPDRLPLCGPVPAPDLAALLGREAGRTPLHEIPAITGQWLNIAHGSRAATTAPLAASWLADQLLGQPGSLLSPEADAIDPRRFLWRQWRRGKLRF